MLFFLVVFHLIFWLFFALLKLGQYLSNTLGFFGDIFGIVVMLVVLGLIVVLVSQSKDTK